MNLSSSRRSPEGVCPASQPASRWSEKLITVPSVIFPKCLLIGYFLCSSTFLKSSPAVIRNLCVLPQMFPKNLEA